MKTRWVAGQLTEQEISSRTCTCNKNWFAAYVKQVSEPMFFPRSVRKPTSTHHCNEQYWCEYENCVWHAYFKSSQR